MNALQYAVREDHEETIAYLRAAMEEAGLSTTPQEEKRPPSPSMIASRYPNTLSRYGPLCADCCH